MAILAPSILSADYMNMQRDFEACKEKASYITPVPGGVGSVTTSVLIGHVVEAAEKI